MRIGVFDSGFGGLAVLRDLVRQFPSHDFVYLGDTARAPYGNRSTEAVQHYTYQAIRFLRSQQCEMIVIACNTASAIALDDARHHFPDTVIEGVSVPLAMAAVRSGAQRVGVLATTATVRSGVFPRNIAKERASIHVVQNACPMWVPLVENGETQTEIVHIYTARYVAPLIAARVDTVILGCTHYELLFDSIAAAMPANVHFIRTGAVMAKHLQQIIGPTTSTTPRTAQRRFFTTDSVNDFQRMGSLFYRSPIVPSYVRIDI